MGTALRGKDGGGMGTIETIPARKGRAVALARGRSVKLVNTHGQQVVDTWAFNRDDLGEFMSMEHSRTALMRVMPRAGDALVTNRRRPILTLVEDTSPGVHDTVLAACDRHRYEQLGCQGYHDNCTDNLAAALAALGLKAPATPAPLNLWMNIPIGADGTLRFEPPVSRKGDHLVLRAEMDCIVVFSACPQDMVPVNGRECRPAEVQFQVM
jgi:uncharacterized protein YcgI (DUF1989 family)